MSGITPAIESLFMYMAAVFGVAVTILLAVQFGLFLVQKLIVELRDIAVRWRDLRRFIREHLWREDGP